MSMKRFIFGSFLVGAVLTVARSLFAKTASAKPAANSTSYDTVASFEAIDAYV